MGEAAEMMLDGILCEGCGEWMGDDEAPGYPRRCPACGGEQEPDHDERPAPGSLFVCTVCLALPKPERPKKTRFRSEFALEQHQKSAAHHHPCPDCSKVCQTARSLADHRAMKHDAA